MEARRTENVTGRDPIQVLLAASPSIDGIVVLTRAGEVIDLAGEPREELLKLAPFATGLFDLATRLCEDTGRGFALDQLIRAESGSAVVRDIDGDRLVFALARRGAAEGALLNDLEWVAKQLALS